MPRLFVLIAIVPSLLQVVVSIPTLSTTVRAVERMVQITVDYLAAVTANPGAYGPAEAAALQAELQAQLQAVAVPATDLAAVTALGGGLATAVALLGTAALTAAGLSVAAGRPVPAAFAYRLIGARPGLVKPILAIALGWVAAAWLPSLLASSSDFQAWAGEPGSPRSILLASLFSVVALVVLVAVIVFAVRWALFIPAVLVESLGVGAGLARAAELSRGLRIRLALAIVGLYLLQAFSVGIAATAVGFAIGLSIGSVAAGFAGYLCVGFLGNVFFAPLGPAMLAIVYRDRTHGGAVGATST